jgi:hypothetical protein
MEEKCDSIMQQNKDLKFSLIKILHQINTYENLEGKRNNEYIVRNKNKFKNKNKKIIFKTFFNYYIFYFFIRKSIAN